MAIMCKNKTIDKTSNIFFVDPDKLLLICIIKMVETKVLKYFNNTYSLKESCKNIIVKAHSNINKEINITYWLYLSKIIF
jgi:hypothetical protein